MTGCDTSFRTDPVQPIPPSPLDVTIPLENKPEPTSPDLDQHVKQPNTWLRFPAPPLLFHLVSKQFLITCHTDRTVGTPGAPGKIVARKPPPQSSLEVLQISPEEIQHGISRLRMRIEDVKALDPRAAAGVRGWHPATITLLEGLIANLQERLADYPDQRAGEKEVPSMNRVKVFIRHSAKDAALAQALIRCLEDFLERQVRTGEKAATKLCCSPETMW